MSNYKAYDYNQSSMVVVNFHDQIQPNTFEFTLHHLISGRLDLTAFHNKYKNAGGGRKAYDPEILLKIILFAYSKGITSSREIQWCCEHNILFKALSCDSVPHWTTIANFVSDNTDAIESLFEEVLLVCSQEGLLGLELFAIDGCKMSSDASKEWSGTFKELTEKRQKIRKTIRHQLKEHQQLDKRKTDEKARAKRIEQSVETLNHAADKIEKFLKTQSPRKGQGKNNKEVKSNLTDNESAKMLTSKGTIQGFNGVGTADKKHQVIVDAQVFGEGAEHHTLQPVLKTIKARFKRIGVNDDIYQSGTIVTADTGFSNEDNNRYLRDEAIHAVIPDNQFRSRDPKFKHQKDKHGKRHRDTLKEVRSVIPATDFTINLKKKTCICPAGNKMWLRNENVDDYGKAKITFEGNLTDCRDCELKAYCMRNPSSADSRKGHGRQVTKTYYTKTSATEWMKQRVDSDWGKQIYSHRMSVIEPVFANIGTNKRLNKFSLRGKKKVQSQWQLYCLVHNIEKLMRYGNIAA